LEEQLGVNLFPQLTEEQKRNTYKLPLTATAVKANSAIQYFTLGCGKSVCRRGFIRAAQSLTKKL
jgi:hypothetical protein